MNDKIQQSQVSDLPISTEGSIRTTWLPSILVSPPSAGSPGAPGISMERALKQALSLIEHEWMTTESEHKADQMEATIDDLRLMISRIYRG